MRIVTDIFTRQDCKDFLYDYAQNPLYSPLNIAYSKEYESQSTFTDLSFGIIFKEELLCVCILFHKIDAEGNESFDGCNRPAIFVQKPNLDNKSSKTIKTLLRNHLNDLTQLYPQAKIFYLETMGENTDLSIPGLYFLENGATLVPELTSIIDLTIPEEELSANVRKSYKSLINWGNKNLEMRVLDWSCITEKDMEDFRQLHIRVAGRETRSKVTWDLMYQMVKEDEAFVVDGCLDGEYVTASFFSYNKNYCYYGVSASVRELFDKPLLHAPMMRAIKYAKSREIKWFETGQQVFIGNEGISKKEIDIASFKRGFGGDLFVKGIIRK